MKSLNTLTGDALEQMIDYKVVDENGASIGTLHSLWSDPATGVVEFLGVKTGWLFGHNHVVPAEKAELDDTNGLVRLPYTEIFVKEAPTMSADAEISEVEEDEIFRYYGLPGRGAFPAAGMTGSSLDQTSPGSAMVQEEEEEMDGSATYIGIPTKLATAPARSISVTGAGDATPNTYRLQRTARPVPRTAPVVETAETAAETVPTIAGMLSPTSDDFINGGAAAITTGVGSGISGLEDESEANSLAGTTGGAGESESQVDTDETRALGEPVPGENLDPLSGEHGAHAVGTGAGAASLGAAGVAIGAAVGGPVGAVVGAIAGAIGGGLAGKGVAESINPTVEDAYWQANYTRAPYYEDGNDYTDYGPAYRVGYEGYGSGEGSVERKDFSSAEQDLERRYEQERGSSKLEWAKAKHAARDAWDRVKSRVGGSNTPTSWPA